MLRDKLMEAMDTLKLYGLKSVLDEVLATGIKQRRTPEEILEGKSEEPETATHKEIPSPVVAPEIVDVTAEINHSFIHSGDNSTD